jgi:hypothetical protein
MNFLQNTAGHYLPVSGDNLCAGWAWLEELKQLRED